MTFCSDHDWKAKADNDVGVRAEGWGKRRRGARRGIQDVSRK